MIERTREEIEIKRNRRGEPCVGDGEGRRVAGSCIYQINPQTEIQIYLSGRGKHNGVFSVPNPLWKCKRIVLGGLRKPTSTSWLGTILASDSSSGYYHHLSCSMSAIALEKCLELHSVVARERAQPWMICKHSLSVRSVHVVPCTTYSYVCVVELLY